jgi:hypothetical protein
MGWGTSFNADIFLNKRTFDSIWDVDEAIADCEETIAWVKNKMFGLACSTPKDVIPNGEDPISYLSIELSELFEMFSEHVVLLYQLRLFRERLKGGEDILSFRS